MNPATGQKVVDYAGYRLSRSVFRGSLKTNDQLREAIEAFFRRHNERAKPFRWRKREVKGNQLRETTINLRN